MVFRAVTLIFASIAEGNNGRYLHEDHEGESMTCNNGEYIKTCPQHSLAVKAVIEVLSCVQGFYVIDGVCEKCPDSLNCLSCSIKNTKLGCDKCKFSKEVNKQRTCISFQEAPNKPVCPAGKYSAPEGPDAPEGCAICPAGKTSDEGATSESQCNPCPIGRYKITGELECAKCHRGTTTSGEGATSFRECTPCPPGHYSDEGQACTPCKAGTAPSKRYPGMWCDQCVGGRWSSEGDRECNVCPDGTTTDPFAYKNASIEACIKCKAGTKSKGGAECTPCPAGTWSVVGSGECNTCQVGRVLQEVDLLLKTKA